MGQTLYFPIEVETRPKKTTQIKCAVYVFICEQLMIFVLLLNPKECKKWWNLENKHHLNIKSTEPRLKYKSGSIGVIIRN